jgi:hypothetical protein
MDWLGYWDGYESEEVDAYTTSTDDALTFGEIKRRVLLSIDKPDGRAIMLVERGVNDALKIIAAIKDFDELKVLDTENAFTAVNTKSYHIVNDLNLTRPKDIYSIRYMDEGNSRKLDYISPSKLDNDIPYTELVGYGRPSWYTIRGRYVELFRIPDSIKPLYISYSQWPEVLRLDSDEIPFLNIDYAIVNLSRDIAQASIEGMGSVDWTQRAQQLLGIGINEETSRPDQIFKMQPFDKPSYKPNEYWADPFYKGD